MEETAAIRKDLNQIGFHLSEIRTLLGHFQLALEADPPEQIAAGDLLGRAIDAAQRALTGIHNMAGHLPPDLRERLPAKPNG